MQRDEYADYYALAGFFTGVGKKGLPSGGQSIFSRGGSDLKHPRTGQPVATRALGEPTGLGFMALSTGHL